MTNEEKEKEKERLKEKWSPILDSLNLTPDKKTWLEEYAEFHQLNEEHAFSHLGIPQQYFGTSGQSLKAEDFNTVPLPISKRINAQTIGLDLVAVKPMEISMVPAKSDKQKLRESRINKIKQLEGEEPNVVLPDDIKVPAGHMFYMDFTYTSGNTQNNI